MRPLTLAAALLLAAVLPPALSAAAQDQSASGIAGAKNIPVEEWRSMASGRTLTYKINGEFWAMEHYTPGSNQVTLQINDGSRLQGTWDYHAPLYCFHWDGQGTACFRHARLGDKILIIETQDGQDTPMLQLMTNVSDTPLACGPAVTS